MAGDGLVGEAAVVAANGFVFFKTVPGFEGLGCRGVPPPGGGYGGIGGRLGELTAPLSTPCATDDDCCDKEEDGASEEVGECSTTMSPPLKRVLIA